VRVRENERPAFRAGYLEDGALALDVLGDVRAKLGAVLHAHLGGVGGVRLPLGRSARGGLLHHLVDLLEGQTLGLGDEEPGVDEGARAQASPDEEHGGLEVALVSADHVRGDDGDDGVPEPVGGGGERTPRERMGRGKISPMTIQAPGPQVLAKKKMKMAMKALWALTAEMLLARVVPSARVVELLKP